MNRRISSILWLIATPLRKPIAHFVNRVLGEKLGKWKPTLTQRTFKTSYSDYLWVRFLYRINKPLDATFWQWRLSRLQKKDPNKTYIGSGSYFAEYGIPLSNRTVFRMLKHVMATPFFDLADDDPNLITINSPQTVTMH